MARWRLKDKHYLSCPGTEWEQKEVDLNTGKQARKVYTVPRHLDPDSPDDQNYRGEIIVCHDGKGQDRDIVFIGDPTADMEPLDEEAEKISTAVARRRVHPIESLSSTVDAPRSVSAGVDPEAFRQMQANIEGLMQANADLQARLAAAEAPPAKGVERRV